MVYALDKEWDYLNMKMEASISPISSKFLTPQTGYKAISQGFPAFSVGEKRAKYPLMYIAYGTFTSPSVTKTHPVSA